jgi:hypothetical protein
VSRLNWQQRQGPQDFDDTAPEVVHYDFDHRRNTTPGAKSSWPEKFGPANIRKAWKAGLVVVAEIEGFPHPVAVSEARWVAQVLEVKTLEGYRIAERIWTRLDARGLRSTGELIE